MASEPEPAHYAVFASLNKNDEANFWTSWDERKAMFEEAEEAFQQGRLPVAPSESEMRQLQGEADRELQSLSGRRSTDSRLLSFHRSDAYRRDE
jgi:hypothetical protein